jgi:serpin B
LLICTVSLLAAPRRGIAEPPTAAEQALVVGAGNHFALDVYAQLDRAQPGENLFFSPASISVALAMTAAGARGPTAAEMAQVLRLDNQLAQAHAYYHELLKQWNAVDPKRPYQLRVANRLWGQRDYSLRPEFLALTRQEYDAAMQLLDFAQADSARREINQWVEKQTNDKIKDLVPAGAIDGTTRLVLTNAIYFKGDWLRPFAKDATRDQDFSVSAQRKVKVPLMRQTAVFGYGEEDSLQVLSMPYAGKDLSMVVLLPREADGLAELEKSLSLERLQSLLSKLRSREVATYIPRFKLECSFGLEPTLEALGMKRAFSPEADFTGISAHRGLYISAVLHKAFVDVNEEGTEAAAATGVFMTKSRVARPPQTPPVFRADHPFLFLICDTQSGAVLFMGRVANPGR